MPKYQKSHYARNTLHTDNKSKGTVGSSASQTLGNSAVILISENRIFPITVTDNFVVNTLHPFFPFIYCLPFLRGYVF